MLLGLLNMDEAALGDTTDNTHFGRTRNPRQAGFTAGGSSGGAGAAVAAGFCEAALGTDTLGSVRIPAAYCGVVGHKPTHGVISTDGVEPLAPQFDTVGIVARTPELAGAVRHWLVPQNETVAEVAGPIGLFPLDGTTAHASTRDALAHMAEKAVSKGLTVQKMQPLDHDVHDIAKAAFADGGTVGRRAISCGAKCSREPHGFSADFFSKMAWAQVSAQHDGGTRRRDMLTTASRGR